MEQEQIVEVKVTAQEIGDVAEKIRQAVMEYHPYSVVLACLTVAIVLNNPSIKLEKLIDGVQKASQWIALFSMDLDGISPGAKAN